MLADKDAGAWELHVPQCAHEYPYSIAQPVSYLWNMDGTERAT